MAKVKQTISYILGVEAIQRKIQLRRNTYNPKYISSGLTLPGHNYLGGSVRTKPLMGVGEVKVPTAFVRLASNRLIRATASQLEQQQKFKTCVAWVNAALENLSAVVENKAKIKQCLTDRSLTISGLSPYGYTLRGFHWAYCWNYMADHEGAAPSTYVFPDPA